MAAHPPAAAAAANAPWRSSTSPTQTPLASDAATAAGRAPPSRAAWQRCGEAWTMTLIMCSPAPSRAEAGAGAAAAAAAAGGEE
jgi:hypothetical protein